MSLARIYLESACPDVSCGPQLDQAENAGLLNYATFLLEILKEEDRHFIESESTVAAKARDLETKQLAQLLRWRDKLSREVEDAALQGVEIVLVELTSPQAITAYEQDKSFAIGYDRRLIAFLGSILSWAYFTARLISRGMNPLDAHSEFLRALADHVQLTYLNRALPNSFEERELGLLNQLNEIERRMVGAASNLSAKFVLYHELGHVYLAHFQTGEASTLHTIESGLISAFAEQRLEFEADRFAMDHMIDPKDGVTTAIVAIVAPEIFFYILALKEAMMPTVVPAADMMVRVHPPCSQRAQQLSMGKRPPAYLVEWEILLQVPTLLKMIVESKRFKIAAQFFREKISAKQR